MQNQRSGSESGNHKGNENAEPIFVVHPAAADNQRVSLNLSVIVFSLGDSLSNESLSLRQPPYT